MLSKLAKPEWWPQAPQKFFRGILEPQMLSTSINRATSSLQADIKQTLGEMQTDMAATTEVIRQSVTQITDQMSSLMSNCSSLISSTSTILMMISSISSLLTGICSQLPGAIRALLVLFGLVQLIILITKFVPVTWIPEKLKALLGVHLEPQAITGLTGLAFSAMVTMFLPTTVQKVLTDFSRSSRIRLLDDFSWLSKVADIVLHVPSYVFKAVSEGAFQASNRLNSPKMGDVSKFFTDLADKFDGWVDQIPDLRSNRLESLADEMLKEISHNYNILHDPAFATKLIALKNDYRQVHDDIIDLQQVPPSHMRARLDLLIRYADKADSVSSVARQEPVAIMFTGRPGCGKTHYVSALMRLLATVPDNTVYTCQPPQQNGKAFMDNYDGETIWYHSDMCQTSDGELSPYLRYIEKTKTKIDAATANKKDSKYFTSKLILSTSNLKMITKDLIKTSTCGWEEANAVYRRWIICDAIDYYTVGNKSYAGAFAVYEWNEPMKEYERKHSFKADDFDYMIKYIKQQVDIRAEEFHADNRRTVASNVPVPSLLAQSGRGNFNFSLLKTDNDRVGMKSTRIISLSPADEEGHTMCVIIDNDEEEQFIQCRGDPELIAKRYLDQGYLHQGEVSTKSGWMVFTRTATQWTDYVKRGVSKVASDLGERLGILLSTAKEKFTTVIEGMTDVDKLLTGLGIVAGLGLIAGVTVLAMRTPDEESDKKYLQSYHNWSKVGKKLPAKKLYAQSLADLPYSTDRLTPEVSKIQNNTVTLDVTSDLKLSTGVGIMVDAYTMIVPLHVIVNEEADIPTRLMIRASQRGSTIFEHIFSVVDYNIREDYALVKMIRGNTVAPRFRKLNTGKEPTSQNVFLVTDRGAIPVTIHKAITSGEYFKFKVGSALLPDDGFCYNIERQGLCGAPLVTGCGRILGWHVAATTAVEHGASVRYGFSRPWRTIMRDSIQQWTEDTIPVVVRDERFQVAGAMPIRTHEYYSVSYANTIKPTLAQEVLNTDPDFSTDGHPFRGPAILNDTTYEVGRVKNLVSRSPKVNSKALEFARVHIRDLISTALEGGKIKKLTVKEMIHGTQAECVDLSKLNKDASAGIPYHGLISDYVDFIDDMIHPTVIDNMKAVREAFLKNVKDPTLIKFKDCIKMENRNWEKLDKPRTFAAGPLHYTLLLREHFGRLNTAFMKHRHRTGIMIGMNATSPEWQRLYNNLTSRAGVFDGDYPSWDGGMVKDFQLMLNEVMAEFAEEPEFAYYLLSYLCETMRVGHGTGYLTSHSVPSGHGLTSLYNSLINKAYLAYAWFLTEGQFRSYTDLGALNREFIRNVYSAVYGDDVAVSVATASAERFNAMTYGSVMRDLDIGFMSAKKKEHTAPFVPITEVTFLKRSFQFHLLLKQVVGPLELEVIKTIPAWYSLTETSPLETEIMISKMDSIQRELFLHGTIIYTHLWKKLHTMVEDKYDMDIPQLTELQMVDMYLKERPNIEAQGEDYPQKTDRELRHDLQRPLVPYNHILL